MAWTAATPKLKKCAGMAVFFDRLGTVKDRLNPSWQTPLTASQALCSFGDSDAHALTGHALPAAPGRVTPCPPRRGRTRLARRAAAERALPTAPRPNGPCPV